ncbi:MAG: hypothetical protein ABI983_01685, partial [Acidobacteriota bacterium]
MNKRLLLVLAAILLTDIWLLSYIVSNGVVLGQNQAPAPQQPPITFRADVNYVEVDTRVLDKDGKFIPGLKPEDFQVFDKDKPQIISGFA